MTKIFILIYFSIIGVISGAFARFYGKNSDKIK